MQPLSCKHDIYKVFNDHSKHVLEDISQLTGLGGAMMANRIAHFSNGNSLISDVKCVAVEVKVKVESFIIITIKITFIIMGKSQSSF